MPACQGLFLWYDGPEREKPRLLPGFLELSLITAKVNQNDRTTKRNSHMKDSNRYRGPAQQVDLFRDHLPAWPLCTDTLAAGLTRQPKGQAIRKRYIQAQPAAMRLYLIFDIDRANGGNAWHHADLPEPYWTSANPDNGHAHICYALAVPVCLTDNARRKPIEFAEAVERALTACLRADRAFGGLITKNPANAHWRTLWGPAAGWELGHLAEWIPDFQKYARRPGPDQLTGIGRNMDTFDHVRRIAYREVLPWKREGNTQTEFRAHLFEVARSYQDVFTAPLPASEMLATAKSIAKWTWPRFTEKGLSEAQAARGRISGQRRRERVVHRNQQIIKDRQSGLKAAELADLWGISKRQVNNILKSGK